MGIILVGDFNQMRDSIILSYPLKHIVTRPTRRNNILDKIYTNINQYYNEPSPLPPIGSSDENVVLLTAKTRMQSPNNNFCRIISHCNDHNGKVMLANALFKFNWISLYRMNDCCSMPHYFDYVLSSLLDNYLPLCLITKHE
jgi:hypothetical protein